MLSFYDEVIFGNPDPTCRLDTHQAILADLRPLIASFKQDIQPLSFRDYIDEDLSVISSMCYLLNGDRKSVV